MMTTRERGAGPARLGTCGRCLLSRPTGRFGGPTLSSLAALGLDVGRGFFPGTALLDDLFAHRCGVFGRKRLRAGNAKAYPVRTCIEPVLFQMPHRQLLKRCPTDQALNRVLLNASLPMRRSRYHIPHCREVFSPAGTEPSTAFSQVFFDPQICETHVGLLQFPMHLVWR